MSYSLQTVTSSRDLFILGSGCKYLGNFKLGNRSNPHEWAGVVNYAIRNYDKSANIVPTKISELQYGAYDMLVTIKVDNDYLFSDQGAFGICLAYDVLTNKSLTLMVSDHQMFSNNGTYLPKGSRPVNEGYIPGGENIYAYIVIYNHNDNSCKLITDSYIEYQGVNFSINDWWYDQNSGQRTNNIGLETLKNGFTIFISKVCYLDVIKYTIYGIETGESLPDISNGTYTHYIENGKMFDSIVYTGNQGTLGKRLLSSFAIFDTSIYNDPDLVPFKAVNETFYKPIGFISDGGRFTYDVKTFVSKGTDDDITTPEPEPQVATLSVSISNWTYGETPSEPVIITNSDGAVHISYSLKGSDVWSSTKPSEPGQYYLKVSVDSTANYSNSPQAFREFTIYPAPQPIVDNSYNGSISSSMNIGTIPIGDTKLFRVYNSIREQLPKVTLNQDGYDNISLFGEVSNTGELFIHSDIVFKVPVSINKYFIYGNKIICYTSNKYSLEEISNAISNSVFSVCHIDSAEENELIKTNAPCNTVCYMIKYGESESEIYDSDYQCLAPSYQRYGSQQVTNAIHPQEQYWIKVLMTEKYRFLLQTDLKSITDFYPVNKIRYEVKPR